MGNAEPFPMQVQVLVQRLKSVRTYIRPRKFADESESRMMHEYAYERNSRCLVEERVSIPNKWKRWWAQRKLARIGSPAVPYLLDELIQENVDEDFQNRVAALLVRQAKANADILDQLKSAVQSEDVSNLRPGLTRCSGARPTDTLITPDATGRAR